MAIPDPLDLVKDVNSATQTTSQNENVQFTLRSDATHPDLHQTSGEDPSQQSVQLSAVKETDNTTVPQPKEGKLLFSNRFQPSQFRCAYMYIYQFLEKHL